MLALFRRRKTQRKPSALTGNAEDLSPKQLLELFVPNFLDDNDGESLCTYERVAQPQGVYLLHAERGMGKTYILKLLKHTMEERGDFVIWFSALSPLVVEIYPNLRKEYPEGEASILWQIAIFEAIGIELLSPIRRKNFLFWDSGAGPLVDYFKKYHPAQLSNAIKYWREQITQSQKSGPLTEVMLSIEAAAWAKISTSLKASEPKEKKVPNPTPATRLDTLETWIWATIQNIQSYCYLYTEDAKSNPLIRSLPEVRSVYVIADGLDQDRPMRTDDLVDLIIAMKELNKKAKDQIKSGELNFKMIISLRDITYKFSIKGHPRFPLTHLRGNKEHLAWEKEESDDIDVSDEILNARQKKDSNALSPEEKDLSLKRFMAKYIAVHSNVNIEEMTIDQILGQSFLPGPVVYFGHVFASGVEFVLEYTERRPREIIYLWQSCAKKAQKMDQPYSAALSPHHLIAGLKDYTTEELIEDIGTEYELEFPGIKLFLKEFAKKREIIKRIVRKEILVDIVKDYAKSFKETQPPSWLKEEEPDQVIEYLFEMGILGIPTGDFTSDTDWPDAIYVKDRNYTDKNIYTSEYLVIRPAFWNYMTNIRTETAKRRQYILSIYKELRQAIINLGGEFNEKELGSSFESILLQFISVAGIVEKISKYPEHVDWEILQYVKQDLDVVWDKFKNTRFFSSVSGKSDIALSVMRENIQSATLQRLPSPDDPEIVYVGFDIQNKKFDESVEHNLFPQKAKKWLLSKVNKKDKDFDAIQKFIERLLYEDDSFIKVLGRAIDMAQKLK